MSYCSCVVAATPVSFTDFAAGDVDIEWLPDGQSLWMTSHNVPLYNIW
jgi:hypothetical protein